MQVTEISIGRGQGDPDSGLARHVSAISNGDKASTNYYDWNLREADWKAPKSDGTPWYQKDRAWLLNDLGQNLKLVYLDLLQGRVSFGSSGASKNRQRHIRAKLLPVEADVHKVPVRTCHM